MAEELLQQYNSIIRYVADEKSRSALEFSQAALKGKTDKLIKQMGESKDTAIAMSASFLLNRLLDTAAAFVPSKEQPEFWKEGGLDKAAAFEEYVANLKSRSMAIKTCKAPLEKGGARFSDIAGLIDVKQRIREQFIEPFRFPQLFPSVGKGILLYGVPGSGKSMIARASVSELENALFFAPKPGDVKGKYEGDTEKNIDAIFKCAQDAVIGDKSKLAVIFFDEFDSIGGQRGDDASMTRSVNAILQNMDGIEGLERVSVMAATNYPDALDPAILRRFTTRIMIGLPDEDATMHLIAMELAKMYSDPVEQGKRDTSDIYIETKESKMLNSKARYLANINKHGGKLSLQDIKDLCKIFSPAHTIPAGTSISSIPEGVGKYGYSPSDITKIVENAIRRAAMNALKSGRYNLARFNDQEYYVLNSAGAGQLDDDVQLDKVISFAITKKDIEDSIKQMPSTIDNKSYVKLVNYSNTS
jgi:SpoVK/Ycf46/Vps4 family AAA+-type ATPase